MLQIVRDEILVASADKQTLGGRVDGHCNCSVNAGFFVMPRHRRVRVFSQNTNTILN